MTSAIGLTGGTFALTFDGQTTSGIAYNATAATVQSALEALSNIAPGDVSVTKTQNTGTAQEWQLTFTGALAGTNVNQVTIDVSNITTFMGPPSAIQATDTQGSTASEVQSVTLNNATGGTFRLAFMGQTTAIAYNASAATVESALEALQAVDQVTVTGNAGGPWTITFTGTHANTNVQQIQGDAATAESGTVSRTLSFAYDAASQLTAADDADSGYDFTYDNLGRVLTTSNADTPNLPDVVFTSTYDSRSNRTSVSATIGGTADYKNDYTFDDLSRMTRVEQNGQTGGNTVASKRANLEYNALGQFSKIIREYKPSGTWTEVFTSHYTYDDDNRITGLAYKRNNVDMFTAYAWTYDNMGRVSQMTSQDGTSAYSYDKTSQVTAVDHSFQADESYTYDSNGNREGGGYTVGSNNRMTSDGMYNYEYDDEGNQTKRTKISDGSYREYKWDHRNRLTQVLEKNSGGTILKQFDYKYDVFDRRIEKSVDNDGPGAGAAVVSRFVHDGAHVALEFNGSNTLTHRYLHGPAIDQIFADEDATNAILWAATDNLGTVRDLINSSGTVQNHLKYESFGKITAESNAAVDHLFAFTGRERDEETGLQQHRRRPYSPSEGNWLAEDQSGFAGGDVNLRRYVFNSSTQFLDPSGFQAVYPVQMPWETAGLSYETWYHDLLEHSNSLAPTPPATPEPIELGSDGGLPQSGEIISIGIPVDTATQIAHTYNALDADASLALQHRAANQDKKAQQAEHKRQQEKWFKDPKYTSSQMTKAQWYQAIQEMKDTIARGDKFKEIHISGHGSAGVAGPFTLQNITNPHSFEAQYLELISTNVGDDTVIYLKICFVAQVNSNANGITFLKEFARLSKAKVYAVDDWYAIGPYGQTYIVTPDGQVTKGAKHSRWYHDSYWQWFQNAGTIISGPFGGWEYDTQEQK